MANVSSSVFRKPRALSDDYFRNRAVSERKNLILLVRKSALIDITRRYNKKAYLSFQIPRHSFHSPPGDIKTFLNDSVDLPTDHGR